MENNQNALPANPLAKYFRQPAIYVKLPSKGQFWEDGSLDLPVTGEIPVYPMTSRDEITLRTPDALMNGSSVVEVIKSCCPNIKDPWQTPSVDVDTLLISIRIASYGHEMNVDTNCPYCNEENNNSIDLRTVLGSIVCPDFSKKVETHNLKVKLRPQIFFGINRQNTISFEEQRIMQAISDVDMDENLKAERISTSMTNLVEIGLNTVTDSTEYIELEDGTIVNNKDYIKEFYNNSDGSIMRDIQDTLVKFNSDAAIKTQTVKCIACTKEYSVPLEFDYANFFAQGS